MPNDDIWGNPIAENVLLRDKFMEPPFSVLDTKGGAWQARKRAWKALGIASHVGREGVVVINNSFDGEKYGRGAMPEVSIFDPALCELMYRWFCPAGGTILDPFAGGSVRGIVANYLGYKYTGIDIRQSQVDSNREQALNILEVTNQPQWYVGDSNVVLNSMFPAPADRVCDGLCEQYDMGFSCPPYADLEVYSDMPGDISNMEYEDFMPVYSSIIEKTVRAVKSGGYIVWVVGDMRDKKGYYRDFISHTKRAFIVAGAMLYNDVVLLQPLGTAMLRANRVFESGGKLIKVHENVLIFKKP